MLPQPCSVTKRLQLPGSVVVDEGNSLFHGARTSCVLVGVRRSHGDSATAAMPCMP